MTQKKTVNFVIGIVTILAVLFFIFIVQPILDEKESEEGQGVYSPAAEQGLWFDTQDQEQSAPKLEENLTKKNYYIILDGSGSMQDDNKMAIAKKALIEFVAHVPRDANLGLAVFDGSGLSERVPLGDDRYEFTNQVQKTTAKGNTPLKEALELAYAKLIKQAQQQIGYGEYNIVVVTDGEASPGHEPDRIVNLILDHSPVIIHTIGFQIGEDHSLNQPGKIYYKSAKNLDELSQGLEEVLAESESFVITDFNE
ncbi:MAG: VWA domain-containing protein [Spirochaetales bacterium]|nr:VWA domain-containing protein [Spirochaetales bacterium]